VIWGDGSVESTGGGVLVLIGGADIFLFNATDGCDRVMDFRACDGDRLDLSATPLRWVDLDSSGNGVLDDADLFVEIDSGATRIDLGAASGADDPHNDVVTLVGCLDMREGDFIFG
jgi:hypothetical protein